MVLIQVKSAAKRTVLGLKNKQEKAFLLFKTQLFHIQVVRYDASGNSILSRHCLKHFHYRLLIHRISCGNTVRTQSKLRKYPVFEGITRLLDFTPFMKMPTVNFYCLKRTLGEGVINQKIHMRKRTFGKRLFLFIQSIPVRYQS